jgi:putative metallohydrolase (TIGR04338 family)
MKEKTQARILYELENQELPNGPAFASFEDMKAFANFVSGSRSNQFTECPKFVQVKCNGDREYSEAVWPNTLWICRKHWHPAIVLHELAHFMAPPKAGHGQKFLECYLYLLKAFMGTEVARLYQEAFIRESLMKQV